MFNEALQKLHEIESRLNKNWLMVKSLLHCIDVKKIGIIK